MIKILPKPSTLGRTWALTLLTNLVSTSLFRWQEQDVDAKQGFSRIHKLGFVAG